MPLANAVLDFHTLGIIETSQGPRQRAVLVAAQKDMVQKLLGAIDLAGLTADSVDLSAFALIRSLYRPSLATYDREGDSFDHGAARGFIELFGLSLRTQASVQGALEDLAPLSLPRQVRRAS